MRERYSARVCVCVSLYALNRDGGVKNDRKGEERASKKGKKNTHTQKALSSEKADRLTGLLRPTETNMWRRRAKEGGGGGGDEKEMEEKWREQMKEQRQQHTATLKAQRVKCIHILLRV